MGDGLGDKSHFLLTVEELEIAAGRPGFSKKCNTCDVFAKERDEWRVEHR